ncbi:SRPBCC family protein [Spirosoma validum]|uniref:SRPBCC domain-containing protein n=1 Tax=Spirosoma validum TaxID=2771355 RepID=A0A927B051_9BACT|nr:SRPBCC domain-containing protein [Spirosoma validum]MBD2752913.1 SRPBCC domain-containing protein [Spirosoma validum]
MNKAPLMNFVVDKDNKQINVEREFNAPLPMVWSAWTESELLDQWWAPKPWHVRTKSMDFKPGGSWLYAMIGPDGETHWSKADFKTIEPQKSFSALDGFCDENGTINTDMPRSLWENTFTNKGESTLVNIVITYDQLADLEQTINMGFKEGFTAGLENLDTLLSTQLTSK